MMWRDSRRPFLGRLVEQGDQAIQHCVYNWRRKPFHELPFPRMQIDYAELIAENDALGPGSEPRQRNCNPASLAKLPPWVIGQTNCVPSVLNSRFETSST